MLLWGTLGSDKTIEAVLKLLSLFVSFTLHTNWLPLREKCPNTEFFLVYGEISAFSPNTGKYGPEKTPYLDTFHAVFPGEDKR